MNETVLTGQEIERTPEEQTLVMRLRIFTIMRWAAIGGVITVTLVARYVFDIGFSTLPVYIVCVAMAIYNLVLIRQVMGIEKLPPELVIRRVRQYTYTHILLDMLALTVLLHYTGGMENPFVFFFVFHIVLASIGLNYRMVYLLSTIAIVMVSLLFGLEYAGVIPHVILEGFVLPDRYQDAGRVVAEVAALGFLLY